MASSFTRTIPSFPNAIPSTPSKGAAARAPDSPASSHHPAFFSYRPTLPHDIMHLILTEHLAVPDDKGNIDLVTISSFSQTNKCNLDMCRRILFRTVAFNMRRKDVIPRVKAFTQIFQDSPGLADYVKVFRITDHTLTDAMRVNEALIPFADATDGREYFSHYEMRDAKQRKLLRSEMVISPAFAQTVKKLNRLEEVDISVFYEINRQAVWGGLSSKSIWRALCSVIFHQEHLSTLKLEGLRNVPADLLKTFRKLRVLSLKNVSLAPGYGHNLNFYAMQDLSETRLYSVSEEEAPQSSLCSLTLHNVSSLYNTEEAEEVLASWRANSNTPGVTDMMHPTHIEVIYDDPAHVGTPTQFLAGMLLGVRHLRLHTMSLGVNESLVVESFGGTKAVNVLDNGYRHPAGWLRHGMLLQPQDIKAVRALETLALSVSFWDGRVRAKYNVAENGELDWALNVLCAVRAQSVREVVLRVKVGGRPEGRVQGRRHFQSVQERALRHFQRAQERQGLWAGWAVELGKERWKDLRAFEVHILAHGIGANNEMLGRIRTTATDCLWPVFDSPRTGEFSLKIGDITNGGPVYLS